MSLVMKLSISVDVSTLLFFILGGVCYFWSHREIIYKVMTSLATW